MTDLNQKFSNLTLFINAQLRKLEHFEWSGHDSVKDSANVQMHHGRVSNSNLLSYEGFQEEEYNLENYDELFIGAVFCNDIPRYMGRELEVSDVLGQPAMINQEVFLD